MYVSLNCTTKEALKDAIKNGFKVRVFVNFSKSQTVERPHDPAPHTWYAEVTLDDDGYIIKVK